MAEFISEQICNIPTFILSTYHRLSFKQNLLAKNTFIGIHHFKEFHQWITSNKMGSVIYGCHFEKWWLQELLRLHELIYIPYVHKICTKTQKSLSYKFHCKTAKMSLCSNFWKSYSAVILENSDSLLGSQDHLNFTLKKHHLSYQAVGSPYYVIHQTSCFIFLFIACICYTVKPKFKPNICDYITIISKIMADINWFYDNYFEVITKHRFWQPFEKWWLLELLKLSGPSYVQICILNDPKKHMIIISKIIFKRNAVSGSIWQPFWKMVTPRTAEVVKPILN